MRKEKAQILSALEYYKQFGDVVFLESQKADHPASENSYFAAKPGAWIKCYGNEVHIFENGKRVRFIDNPWNALQQFRDKHQNWLFGFLGYDLKNHLEALNSENIAIQDTPDMYFMVPGLLVRIDENGNWHVLIGQLDTTALNTSYDNTIRVQESFLSQKEKYSRAFYRVQESITEGEFYEINLSYPLEFGFKGNPIALYTRMKHTGPVPFGAYLQISDTSICSSSPERFLAKKGTKVSTQPIKGTSPNSSDPKEKDSIKSLNSVKNKAENLMIVDLVRNDLGRIAKTGTVKVRDLFEIQSFETVHQLVSTVECEIGENADPIEVIKACFPMGSMTGAPKIAAMQAIEKLEWYKRGIYSGAIGYIKPNDDFDFNVVIRSAIIQKGKLVYPVGGAITSDSELEDEWQETLVKAKALTQSFK